MISLNLIHIYLCLLSQLVEKSRQRCLYGGEDYPWKELIHREEVAGSGRRLTLSVREEKLL